MGPLFAGCPGSGCRGRFRMSPRKDDTGRRGAARDDREWVNEAKARCKLCWERGLITRPWLDKVDDTLSKPLTWTGGTNNSSVRRGMSRHATATAG